MTEQKVNGIRVAILATNGFEEAELVEPRAALDNAGAKTTLLAPKSGKIYGMKHHDKGREFAVDLELAKAQPDQFDAVQSEWAASGLHLPYAVAAGVGWADQGSNADQLPHNSGRHTERRRNMGRRTGCQRPELGQQSPTL